MTSRISYKAVAKSREINIDSAHARYWLIRYGHYTRCAESQMLSEHAGDNARENVDLSVYKMTRRLSFCSIKHAYQQVEPCIWQ